MNLLSELFRDIGYGLRVLRRAWGFTTVAVATLAVGIGASTAVFTVVDSVLLNPLRFPDSHRLAALRWSSGSRFSPHYLHDLRRHSTTLRDIAGWYDTRTNLTGRGEPVEVLTDRVTANFFEVLGATAHIGRTFTASRDLEEVKPEVVLGYGLWQRRFGADPGIIGQSLTLDGRSVAVVGVMPARFKIRTNELTESRAELWMPFPLLRDDPTGGILNVVGRLAPGMSMEQAQVEVALIAQRIQADHPSYVRNWRIQIVPLLEATVAEVRPMLLVMSGTVAIFLVIACANVANLLLSRGAKRHAEVAIRVAIGATTGRLVRQLLTESAILAAAGGAVGLLIATWGSISLISMIPEGVDLPRLREVQLNARLFQFAAVVTIGTAFLFGLFPALHVARRGPRSMLAGGHATRWDGPIVVAQIALSLMLLAGAGLLGRSFWRLARVDPGFRPAQVLTMRTTLPESRYDNDDRVRTFGGLMLERFTAVPGVEAVGFANYLPLTNVGIGGTFEIQGRQQKDADDRPSSWMAVVGGNYFDAMGIPLVRGRLPGAGDTEHTQPVFVIDEQLARRYWGDRDPIGDRLVWRGDEDQRLSGEIIAIVGSVRWAAVASNPQPTTYFWFPQDPRRDISIVARVTARNPSDLGVALVAQVRAIDPNQPVADIRPMHEFLSANLARHRFTMVLLAGFAAAALLLAAIGVYGVIAFSVAERTREIGVRVALGAEPGDVVRLIMRRALLLVGAGLTAGVAAALASGRFVAGLLYGVTPSDAGTLLGVIAFLAAVGLLASYVPARRATRVDPIVALRSE